MSNLRCCFEFDPKNGENKKYIFHYFELIEDHLST